MPALGTIANVMFFLNDIVAYLRGRSDGAMGRGRPEHEPVTQAEMNREDACQSGLLIFRSSRHWPDIQKTRKTVSKGFTKMHLTRNCRRIATFSPRLPFDERHNRAYTSTGTEKSRYGFLGLIDISRAPALGR
jgi:hypothetical protein